MQNKKKVLFFYIAEYRLDSNGQCSNSKAKLLMSFSSSNSCRQKITDVNLIYYRSKIKLTINKFLQKKKRNFKIA